jgi:hypothetical protein
MQPRTDPTSQLDLFASAPGLRRRDSYPAGHIVHMSLDHSARPSASVVHCDCGWQNRVAWLPGMWRFQDAAVNHHWDAIEK